jgi:uncharacterized membrane protein YsdA (DUF1294 family)
MIIFLFVLNVFVFGVFGYDKFLATQYKRRISENSLLLVSFFGGTIGAIFGMLIFSHKISKTSFLLKFGLIVLIQIVLIYFFQKYYLEIIAKT